jgi:GDP-L-fucose synthase
MPIPAPRSLVSLPALWSGAKVLVTGGSGFLGRHVCATLTAVGAHPVSVGRADADLTDRAATEALLARVRPDVVVHCAVQGGGIGWMRHHPVASGRDNVLMNVHLLDAAAKTPGCTAFIGVSSACAYPRICPVPFVEADLWNGYPEPTNGPYALSKRIMMDLGRAWHQERPHGFLAVFPILANLYGPGDHIEPERAHVVAALMQRCVTLPADTPLTVWGTGRATREFLYVTDAAEGILSMLAWRSPEPLNIGTGIEVPIAELARAVVRACEHPGGIAFDHDKPDGQPRKCLSVHRATTELGWTAPTDLDTGLRATVAWYRQALAERHR